MDIKVIAESAAKKVSEEIDEQIPDGIRQRLVGNFLEAFGQALVLVGKDLAGPQNEDADA